MLETFVEQFSRVLRFRVAIFSAAFLLSSTQLSAIAAPNFVTVDFACTYPGGASSQLFLESFTGYGQSELLPASGTDVGITVGDFNGDSYPDLVLQNQNTLPQIRRLLNLGTAATTFQFDSSELDATLSRAATFSPAVTRDLNADGIDDLVIPFQSGGVNQRGGTYRSFFNASGVPSSSELPTACLQTEGNDLPVCVDGGSIPLGVETLAVATAKRSGTDYYHISTVQRAFRASAPTTTSQILTYRPTLAGAIDPEADGFYIPNDITAAAIAGGDLNGDDREDFAFATLPGNGVIIRFQTADGRFIPASRSLPVISSLHIPIAMAVSDLTLDGKNDLAILYDAPTGADYVLVRVGAGDGLFSEKAYRITVPAGPISMSVKDVTGDGKADIFVLGAGSALLLRNSDGDFDNFLRLTLDLDSSGIAPNSCAVGDFQHALNFRPDPNVAPNPSGGVENWGSLRPRRAKLTVKQRKLYIQMQKVQTARYLVRLKYKSGKKTVTRTVRSKTFKISVKSLPRNTPITVTYVFESTRNASLVSVRSPSARKTIK